MSKKYLTKGEEFYKKNRKNKKKLKTFYEVIKTTKMDIDNYYANDDVDINELMQNYYKLNSFKYIKNNIALVLVIGFGTAYIGEIISNFFDRTIVSPETAESIIGVLLASLGDTITFAVSISIVCYLLYKRVLKDYRNPFDVYILPYEKKVIYEKIKSMDEDVGYVIALYE